MLIPAILLNSSPAKWEAEPVPNEAIVTLPGFALAWAISSATLLAGTDGCATNIIGKAARPETGAISRRTSNGRLGNMLVLISRAESRRSSAEDASDNFAPSRSAAARQRPQQDAEIVGGGVSFPPPHSLLMQSSRQLGYELMPF
jgi:hypothetical protein